MKDRQRHLDMNYYPAQEGYHDDFDIIDQHQFTRLPFGLKRYQSTQEALDVVGGPDPIYCLYPKALEKKAHTFLNHLNAKIFYAVKCNPHSAVLHFLGESGIQHFDVASIREVEAVHAIHPNATMAFMHPIKAAEAIQKAYALGVRIFAFDSACELKKILISTQYAQDLTLVLRLKLETVGQSAAYALTGKFGASASIAPHLLKEASPFAQKLGVSFHVGSQCMDPSAYAQAIAYAKNLVDQSGVDVHVMDIGGGFPVRYPNMEPPDLIEYFQTIHEAIDRLEIQHMEIWAEPGRALVADGGSTLARVELRRDHDLYLNDGTYGSLFDAGTPRWQFPTQKVESSVYASASSTQAYAILDQHQDDQHQEGFRFFGPTCDSLDVMDGPFMLQNDIDVGDWIEIGQLGSYGATMGTQFNGFYSENYVVIEDLPLIDRK